MSQATARPHHAPEPRTLWDEGRRPGHQVLTLSVLGSLAVAVANVWLTGGLSLFFDLTFVVICLAAALAVRPQDMFLVGVMPPLLLLATVTLLAGLDRGAVADEVDSLVQAIVSGLAHHAGGLVSGYAAALLVLGVRQTALRNARRLRSRP